MIKLTSFVHEEWKADGGTCFGVVPKSIWSKNYVADENNMIDIASRCLLIETENRLFLIDSGWGNKQSEKYYKARGVRWVNNLQDAILNSGYHPDKVTDVILTHLHDDHVGGLVVKNDEGLYEEVCKNARYHISVAQWESYKHPNRREAASYYPENMDVIVKSGRISFVSEDVRIANEIELRILNGHTAGLMIVLIDFKDKKIVHCADFIPSAGHVPIPYVASHDINPLLAMQEKENFLNEAFDNNYILFYGHDYTCECSSLVMTEKGIRAGEVMNLSVL